MASLVFGTEGHRFGKVQVAMRLNKPFHFFVLRLDHVIRFNAREDFTQAFLFVSLSQGRVNLTNKRLDTLNLFSFPPEKMRKKYGLQKLRINNKKMRKKTNKPFR